MYDKHFGLTGRPFRSTADTDLYYPATGHERALTQLRQGLADGEGVAVLTAEAGLGKTLLCHRLQEDSPDVVVSAFLASCPARTPATLFQALLFDLGQPYVGLGEQELRLALTEYLLQNFQAGRRTVLVIDEAHLLHPDVLEELRLLGNLEARQGRAVQVVLAGLPALLDTLRADALTALNQRVVHRAALEPLDVHEAADFLLHQLRAVGGDKIVADEALEMLARGTRGVPRLLNQAGHQALALACSAGAAHVDAEAAVEALAVLGIADDAIAEPLHPTAGEAAEEVGGTVRALRTDQAEESSRTSRLYAPRRPA